MHKRSANFAVGLNCPVSIELMVLRETPAMAASSACEKPFSKRFSLSLFLKSSSAILAYLHRT